MRSLARFSISISIHSSSEGLPVSPKHFTCRGEFPSSSSVFTKAPASSSAYITIHFNNISYKVPRYVTCILHVQYLHTLGVSHSMERRGTLVVCDIYLHSMTQHRLDYRHQTKVGSGVEQSAAIDTPVTERPSQRD